MTINFEKTTNPHNNRYLYTDCILIMPTENNIILPGGCRMIDFPKFQDDRGNLSFAEGLNQIPFHIERMFWMYGIPKDKTRGGHSHIESAQVLVPVTGSFNLLIDDGTNKAQVHMGSASRGILLPPGIWCELRDFAPGTAVMVFASYPYNEDDYVQEKPGSAENTITVIPYDASKKDIWNGFVRESKNGTFLLERDYMEYHSDRFRDCSLMFYKRGKLIALLPANWVESENAVKSHGGLTYGGLVTDSGFTIDDALQVFKSAKAWMKKTLGANRWVYTPIPYIYCSLPSEEDMYALFRNGAVIRKTEVASVVDLSNRLPFRELRKRGYKKAMKKGLEVSEADFEKDICEYWAVLENLLHDKFESKPVHTVDEMKLLHSRFPDSIKLYVVKNEGKIIAGTVIYDTGQVARTQYIAASEEGKECGALDLLFRILLDEVYSDRKFFDFGGSTLYGGNHLNEGLIFQKEGFGGRAVIFNTYEMLF